MKTLLKSILCAAFLSVASVFSLTAQNSLPAPGSGGSLNPAPSNPGGPGGGGPGPAPVAPAGPVWGSPWYSTWNTPIYVNTALSSPTWQNAGTVNVVGVGYDVEGIWRSIPMTIQYTYNGVNYNITVVNAWDPWSNSWNYNVDANAYSTYYLLRGTYYNYYVVLSTGTYYFNL